MHMHALSRIELQSQRYSSNPLQPMACISISSSMIITFMSASRHARPPGTWCSTSMNTCERIRASACYAFVLRLQVQRRHLRRQQRPATPAPLLSPALNIHLCQPAEQHASHICRCNSAQGLVSMYAGTATDSEAVAAWTCICLQYVSA